MKAKEIIESIMQLRNRLPKLAKVTLASVGLGRLVRIVFDLRQAPILLNFFYNNKIHKIR